MSISKSELAIRRHNLKNQLVQLKTRDLMSSQIYDKMQDDNFTLKALQWWLVRGHQARKLKRKQINEALDKLERVNPKGEY